MGSWRKKAPNSAAPPYRMAAPIYALARLRPAVVKLDRVAVIPAAIYVTYTLCGDKTCVIQMREKVKETADFRRFIFG
ncbi:hypothetical protein COO92_15145 [Thalassospira lohafexi]|uniref:Uncharacterized protein n=1 Tax=Thalassospira lohafexi TaxID=744227 RepID=A0A2N3L3M8_9PROT|nr:hypothetical protein COO92_15145 [Thalassospira lohafexi]